MMESKVCLIYNYAQHYRLGIFKLLDNELNIEFYFGDRMNDVKKLDYKELLGFKDELSNKYIYKNVYWQSGAVSLVFNKSYNTYILLGEYYCLSTWIFLLIAKLLGKKTHLWTHGWYGRESLLHVIIKKVFYRLGTSIFLYGDYAKELMLKEGFSRQKMNVIYNSLNYNEQLVIRKALKREKVYEDFFRNTNPVCLFVGRLTYEKKLEDLLELGRRLKNENIDINIVYVGAGEAKLALERKTEDLNVWFYGPSYDEEKLAMLISQADVCISPGNVGLTAIHAMMFGCPVLTHNDFRWQGPEFEAIKEGETGAFFERGNIDSLVKTTKSWLEYSKEHREEIRLNCYKIIDEKYNPNYQLKVIKKALGR